MREILFRGKRIDNGEWVYGCLIFAPNYNCILQDEEKVHPMDFPYLDGESGVIDGKATPVIPETIGQYTGLTDKNGKKIFEGDIIKTDNGKRSAISAVEYGDFEPKLFYDLLKVYVMPRPQEKIHGLYAITTNGEEMFLANAAEHIEVIGNIYDNPEQFGIVEQLKGE